MNIIKKYAAILFASVLVIAVSACGDKEESKTFEWSDGKTDLSLTYYYKNDVVLRQTAKNTLHYAGLGVANKEEAMQRLGPISEKYKSIKGVEESLDYSDTYATEILKVDYSVVDRDALQKIQGAEFTGDVKEGISMSKSEALLKSRGFKEVK
ncbi:YehR family lipoprotein [Enterobacter sp.]|uniref:YehR family lipoprotein n=1 Tax=Enterobacter sp. TaxID=42895 RepID=UPI00296F67F7|nr:YehR family lipoprotein [Enterobacter sp.]